MEEFIANQVYTFLYSIIFGIFLGLLYDIFRIVRLLASWKNISIFFQDILYFFISGIFTFIFILCYNQGIIRFYIFIAIFLGWTLYHFTIGKIVYSMSARIICIFNKIFIKVYRIIVPPIKRIISKIIDIFCIKKLLYKCNFYNHKKNQSETQK